MGVVEVVALLEVEEAPVVEAAQVVVAHAVTPQSAEAHQPIHLCTDVQATQDPDHDPALTTEKQSMGAINIDIPAPKFTSMTQIRFVI
jgi:hypothetical protein